MKKEDDDLNVKKEERMNYVFVRKTTYDMRNIFRKKEPILKYDSEIKILKSYKYLDDI